MNMIAGNGPSTAAPLDQTELSPNTHSPAEELQTVAVTEETGIRETVMQEQGDTGPDLFAEPQSEITGFQQPDIETTNPAQVPQVTDPVVETRPVETSVPGPQPEPTPEVQVAPSLWDRATGVFQSIKTSVVETFSSSSAPDPETGSASPGTAASTERPSLWERAGNVLSSVKTAFVDIVMPAENDTRTLSERIQHGLHSVTDTCTDFVCDLFHVSDETRQSWKRMAHSFVSSVSSLFTQDPLDYYQDIADNSLEFVSPFIQQAERDVQNPLYDIVTGGDGPDSNYTPAPSYGMVRIKNSWEELAAASEMIAEGVSQEQKEDEIEQADELEAEAQYRQAQVQAARAVLPDDLENSQVLDDYVEGDGDYSYRRSVEDLVTEVRLKEAGESVA